MMASRPISISTPRTRLFSSSTRTRYDYRRPQAVQVLGRSILRVQGKDSAKFLKGLTCKDVDGLPGGGYSGFINPTVSRFFRACVYC
jgi:folate-binding Fe-S cluster repair protein YgfZ